jgi:hypothetical protein
MYQVFQDGKQADSFGYPGLSASWSNSVFNTLPEAVTYAILWAYPYSLSDVDKDMLDFYITEFEENYFEVDMGMSEFPVIMSIKEI